MTNRSKNAFLIVFIPIVLIIIIAGFFTFRPSFNKPLEAIPIKKAANPVTPAGNPCKTPIIPGANEFITPGASENIFIKTTYTPEGEKYRRVTCNILTGVIAWSKYNPETGKDEETFFYMPDNQGYSRILFTPEGKQGKLISYRADGSVDQVGYYADDSKAEYTASCDTNACTPWDQYIKMPQPEELAGKNSINNPYSLYSKDLSYCALFPTDKTLCR